MRHALLFKYINDNHIKRQTHENDTLNGYIIREKSYVKDDEFLSLNHYFVMKIFVYHVVVRKLLSLEKRFTNLLWFYRIVQSVIKLLLLLLLLLLFIIDQ